MNPVILTTYLKGSPLTIHSTPTPQGIPQGGCNAEGALIVTEDDEFLQLCCNINSVEERKMHFCPDFAEVPQHRARKQ